MPDTIKKENSYRNIMKGTSIFGGVQVFNILVAAIRVKFVALILGPAGMGVAGLFTNASTTIQQITSLGLGVAIVKETGARKDNNEKLQELLASLRPFLLLTSAAGALVCFAFPSLLSRITFGDETFSGGFSLLGVCIFFSILGTGIMSVLQGLHEVKRLSKASVIGSLTGLCVGLPLYWLFGTSGIVPAMTVLAVCTFIWYYVSLRKSLPVVRHRFSRKEHLPLIRHMVILGLILMSNDLFRNISTYAISVFVRAEGGMTDVGLYQSCNTMTAQYSAIVFTAMAMDYLPRLSASADDDREMCRIVDKQIEIVGLIITPVICAVILFAPVVISILQTKEFLTATPLLRWLAMATAVRGLMYPLGYITFAKDNKKVFFWMESIGANILTLILTCGGYHFFGLTGLGYAAVADCAICLAAYILVNNRLYGYRPDSPSVATSLYAICASCVTLLLTLISGGWIAWTGGGLVVAITSVASIRQLGKKINREK